MRSATESFSEDELYHLWKPFENDEDHGAEALMGFAGYPLTAQKSVIVPLLLIFQKRSEEDAIKGTLDMRVSSRVK